MEKIRNFTDLNAWNDGHKLVLIDGNAILHRAYHALPPLTSRLGEPINAVYGLISMLLRIIQNLCPTHIAVAFDRKEPTFRHKEFVAYQAQRPPTDKDLLGQFDKAREAVSAFNIPIFEKAGYEADDVIGTIANQAKGLKLKAKSKKPSAFSPQPSAIDEVVIVTGDKDILQLVNDKVKVYLPVRGLSEAKTFGINEVIEKMGVAPELIPDYKALVGDQSDNYKGVSGIGPKTAIGLLSKFKSKNGIYDHLDDIPGTLREKLEKGKDDADLSHRLATIIKDVPIEVDFGKMDDWRVDSPAVLSLFKEFGFKTLIRRVKDIGKSIVAGNQTSLF